MVPLTEQPLHIVLGKGAIAVIGFVATMSAAILILGWLAHEGDHDSHQPSFPQRALMKGVRRARFSNWLHPQVSNWLRPNPRWRALWTLSSLTGRRRPVVLSQVATPMDALPPRQLHTGLSEVLVAEDVA